VRISRLGPSLALCAALLSRAPAGAAPVPVLPVPAPPAPATGPTGAVLGDAYRALQSAVSANPAAAVQAQFLYAQALGRLRAGDAAAARADAAMALGLAGAAGPATVAPLSPARGLSAGGYAPSAPLAVPPGGLLPPELREVRDRIVRDVEQSGKPLPEAAAPYRAALAAYHNGDLPAALSGARAAAAAAAKAERAMVPARP
jgi:hypothetical protein